MHKLKSFIDSQPRGYTAQLARALKKDPTYLWRQLHGIRPFSESDAIEIEKYTRGAVKCEDILPGVDWAFLRLGQPAVQTHE